MCLHPSGFPPVKGGWGRQGATNVLLAKAKAAGVRTALLAAWRNVAPARLARQVKGG
jgi:hypothetical protein